MPAKRLLIVVDDPMFRRIVFEQLQTQPDIDPVERQLAAVDDEPFDAALVGAAETATVLRERGARCPIILLAEPGADVESLLAADEGLSDVVVKPFRLGVLLARLRAQIQLHERSQDLALPIGPYVFRPAMKCLVREDTGARIRLTEKEAAILMHLHQAGAQAVSRESLLEEVWGYNAGVTTHTLETHIYRLRQKIETDPADARILITDAGGYRLAM